MREGFKSSPFFSKKKITIFEPMTNKKLIFVLLLVIGIFSCKVTRFIIYNFAGITDHKKFPARELKKADHTHPFYTAAYSPLEKVKNAKKEEVSVDAFLASSKTVAFLVIKSDSIVYEKYYQGYHETSIVPSFSMAKSVTSILIGCAIDDGLIKSVDEPMVNYIPELKKNGLEKVTIKHLLQMTSGIAFNESYTNPFGDAASIYYGTDLHKTLSKLTLQDEPGTKFHYKSGDTQFLGWVLERALKDKPITQYLQEKIWTPLGMEFDASWSLDKKNGTEKTFCCLNARARDFAKIGRLYLNKGNWNGQQIVSKKWVEESTKIDLTAGSPWYYQYQWWMANKKGDYGAHGILGQYVYVCPAKNIIIVRLGKKEGEEDWWKFFAEIAERY